MKMNLSRNLKDAILCLALFLSAAVPFAASAQSEVNKAQTNAPSAQKMEAKEPAGQKTEAKTSSEQKTEAKDSTQKKEITLVLDGKISRGEFIFEGNTIRFIKGYPDPMPANITVDGKHWKDLSKPFVLDYTPDFAKAGILEKNGKMRFSTNAMEECFSLRIVSISPESMLETFRVRLPLKNQLPYKNLADNIPPPPSTVAPDFLLSDGDYYDELHKRQTKIWNDCIKERKIILEGVFNGHGAFIFEGNTIRYKHRGGKQPYNVNINGRGWASLTEPFKLDFQIETEHPEIIQTDGTNPVKLTQIDDKRFELFFSDPEHSSPTHSSCYTVTITPGNAAKNQ